MDFGEYYHLDSSESYKSKKKTELSFRHGCFMFEGEITFKDEILEEMTISGVNYIEPMRSKVCITKPVKILLFSEDIDDIERKMFTMNKDVFNPKTIKDIKKMFDDNPNVKQKFQVMVKKLKIKHKVGLKKLFTFEEERDFENENELEEISEEIEISKQPKDSILEQPKE